MLCPHLRTIKSETLEFEAWTWAYFQIFSGDSSIPPGLTNISLGEFLKRGQAESESWDNQEIIMSKKFCFLKIFIYLALPGRSYSMLDLHCGRWDLQFRHADSCSMWDLVP